VCYLSGHGYEKKDGRKSYLLVVDNNGSADWETDSGNVCIQNELEAIAEEADNSTFLLLIIDACRTKTPDISKNQLSDKALKMKMSKYFTQQVLWWATSKERIALAGGQGEMSLFSKCLHDALQKVITGVNSELMLCNELYLGGMPALKNIVHSEVCEQATATLKRRSTENVAQRPSMDDAEAREAFTFALPPRPVLPLPDARSDCTDLRWKTLWEQKKIVKDDAILYLCSERGSQFSGDVQSDGRIKYKYRRREMFFSDPVQFASFARDPVAFARTSPDHDDDSAIDADKMLFTCCHLCLDDDDKIESLEDLLRTCETHSTPSVVGGIGKSHSSGKGKEPHNDEVEGESGGAQVRKRAREKSPHAPSNQPMVQHGDERPSKHTSTPGSARGSASVSESSVALPAETQHDHEIALAAEEYDSSDEVPFTGTSVQPPNASSLGEGSAGGGAGRKRGRENASVSATEEGEGEQPMSLNLD